MWRRLHPYELREMSREMQANLLYLDQTKSAQSGAVNTGSGPDGRPRMSRNAALVHSTNDNQIVCSRIRAGNRRGILACAERDASL